MYNDNLGVYDHQRDFHLLASLCRARSEDEFDMQLGRFMEEIDNQGASAVLFGACVGVKGGIVCVGGGWVDGAGKYFFFQMLTHGTILTPTLPNTTDLVSYLYSLPFEYWVDYCAPCPRYGYIANAVGESVHNMFERLRFMPVLEACYAFVERVAVLLVERRAEYVALGRAQLAATGAVSDFMGLVPDTREFFAAETQVRCVCCWLVAGRDACFHPEFLQTNPPTPTTPTSISRR